MGTVTGFTAQRMLEIENSTIVDGEVQGDSLILRRRDNTPINAGSVRGPQGVPGPTGAASITVCTRATRPGIGFRYNGMFIYETDTDQLFSFNGSTWVYEGGIIHCTSTTRPTGNRVFVGLVIFETNTGRYLVYSATGWLSLAAGANVRPSDFFNVNQNNFTNRSFVSVGIYSNFFITPVPVRTLITVYINMGGNSQPNRTDFRIVYPDSRPQHTAGWGGAQRAHRHLAVGQESCISFVAKFDYVANDNVGFMLQARVDEGNIYFNADIVVDYAPLTINPPGEN